MTQKFSAALAICVLSAGTALAGRQVSTSVQIVDTYDPVNDIGHTATGSLGAVRNSANSVEYIGCSVTSTATSVTAICRATDATGLSRLCVTGNAKQIEIIRSIRSDSSLLFQWGPMSLCRKIWVRQTSENPPKK